MQVADTGKESAVHDKVDLPPIEAPQPNGTEEKPRKGGSKSSPYKGVTLFRPTMKWRAQISAAGKTTSLGDHDTEEDAARAFDRAAINKAGRKAKTNFPLSDYESEIDRLTELGQLQMVALLRSKARKSGNQTSPYRGVSLLKQSGKWHAQINVCGKQVHLGFFPSEEEAARAYDRSAINKGSRDGGRVVINKDIQLYAHELEVLRRVKEPALVEALSLESRRTETEEILRTGDLGRAAVAFGDDFDCNPNPETVLTAAQILQRAERCQPKSTEANPLYEQFTTIKQRAKEGSFPTPVVTTPPRRVMRNQAADSPMRSPSRPKKRAREDVSDDSETETDEEMLAHRQNTGEPQRRSTRNRATVKYNLVLELDEQEEGYNEQDPSKTPQRGLKQELGPSTPALNPNSPNIKPRSFKRQRRPEDGESDEEEAKQETRRKKSRPAHVEPADTPSLELLAAALAGFKSGNSLQPLGFSSLELQAMQPGPPHVNGLDLHQLASEASKTEASMQAPTLQSQAPDRSHKDHIMGAEAAVTDKCSQANNPALVTDKTSMVSSRNPLLKSDSSHNAPDATLGSQNFSVTGLEVDRARAVDASSTRPDSMSTWNAGISALDSLSSPQEAETQAGTPSVARLPGLKQSLGSFGQGASNVVPQSPADSLLMAKAIDALRMSQQDRRWGSDQRKSSHSPSQAANTVSGGVKGPVLPAKGSVSPSRKKLAGSPSKSGVASPGKKASSMPVSPSKPLRGAALDESNGNLYAKSFAAKPRTQRQRAMLLKRQGKVEEGDAHATVTAGLEASPKSSSAANALNSSSWSANAQSGDLANLGSHKTESAVARGQSTDSSPPNHSQMGAALYAVENGLLTAVPRSRNRRKAFCKPMRAVS